MSLVASRRALLRASVGGRESGFHIISITSAFLHNIKNLGGWELPYLTGSFRGGGSWTAYNSGGKSCSWTNGGQDVAAQAGSPNCPVRGGGGRGLGMWVAAMRRHIWNEAREPVRSQNGRCRGDVTMRRRHKARHAAHERAHLALSVPHVRGGGPRLPRSTAEPARRNRGESK